jgi:hypothetical protein
MKTVPLQIINIVDLFLFASLILFVGSKMKVQENAQI